jgi:hypothetical protein
MRQRWGCPGGLGLIGIDVFTPNNPSFRFFTVSLPDHWGRSSVRGIAFRTNNASNVDTVLNGRIHLEEYRARKVLRNFGRAFNSRAFDVILYFDRVGLGERRSEQKE